MIRAGICPLCPQVYIGIGSRSAPLLLALPAVLRLEPHAFDGPLRYGASVRFETMPSSPMRQTCSNTVGPSPKMVNELDGAPLGPADLSPPPG
jgi:hypothetical protein